MRVGRRLKHSDLKYDAKYPVVLPGKHPVTELIIRHYHHLNGHVGVYNVLATNKTTASDCQGSFFSEACSHQVSRLQAL